MPVTFVGISQLDLILHSSWFRICGFTRDNTKHRWYHSNSYFLQEVLAISYINSDDKILKDA